MIHTRRDAYMVAARIGLAAGVRWSSSSDRLRGEAELSQLPELVVGHRDSREGTDSPRN